jgi:hypothetical protein
VSSPDVQFLASPEAQSELSSLRVVSSAEAGGPVVGQLSQGSNVLPGEVVSVSFWAKATDGGENAVVMQLSPDGVSSVIAVPGGTYDWMQLSAEYVVPPGQTYFDARIAVQGPTAGTWVDSVSVTVGAGGTSRAQNGGFEASSGELTFSNSELLFSSTRAVISLASRRAMDAQLHWVVRDAASTVVLEGDASLANCATEIDLASLANGYFNIEVQASIAGRPVVRATSFAVVDALPPTADDNSPFGVFLHYTGGQARIDNLVSTLDFAGVNYARVEIPWDLSETTPGVYRYPGAVTDTMAAFTAAGIEPLLVPAYYNPNYDNTLTPSSPEGLAGYARFSGDVAAKFRAAGDAVEVYNEFDHTFNNGNCGRTPQCYMEMLAPTAAEVHASSPDSVIVAPGNAGMGIKLDWLGEFFAIGGLELTDVVSMHPYVQPEAPEQLASDLTTLQQMILDANGGVPKPVWITEMGWADAPGGVSAQQQANYFVRTMAMALGHGVSRVYWFEAASLSLDAQNGEVNFGMYAAPSSAVPNANAPKITAVAQAVMARQIAGKTFSAMDTAPAGVNSYVFADAASATRVMWTTSQSGSVRIDANGPITITDMLGQVTTVQPEAGVVNVPLSDSPIYVTGEVRGVAGN